MIINLIRNANPQGKAVKGMIFLPFDPSKTLEYATLENRDFLIPEGTYPLRMTWSPKFKKLMPEICDVPEREGIRIHLGTKPEHSQGCVLVTLPISLENIKSFINYQEKYNENEQLQICIRRA